MFQYKAKSNVRVQTLSITMLENLRMELSGLEDELANGFIHKYGVPVCDFKVNDILAKDDGSEKFRKKQLRKKFQDWVRRAFVLSLYKK